MANQKTFVLYTDYEDIFLSMNDRKAGAFIKGIFSYCRTGEIPELEKSLMPLFVVIKNALDRDREKYEQVCRNRSEAAKKRESEKKAAEQPRNCHSTAQQTTIVTDNDTVTNNKTDSVSDTVTDNDGAAPHRGTAPFSTAFNNFSTISTEGYYRGKRNRNAYRHMQSSPPSYDITLLMKNAMTAPVNVSSEGG